MAEAADAARERVLVARAQLGDELVVLEASARSAIDIPAKVKASPVKAAAVAGTVGFVALRGPKRVVGRLKRAVRGPNAPMPKRMLPDEIEETLGRLGSDGDAVRGTLERDFADYVKSAAKSRSGLRTFLILSVVQPMAVSGAKAASRWLFSAEEQSFDARLSEVRGRLDKVVGQRAEGKATETPVKPPTSGKPPTGAPGAKTGDIAGA